MVCDICHKNVAVIFVNKLENGKNTQQALCLQCASKQGFSMEQLMRNSGISEKDMENISRQMNELMENIDPEALEKILPPDMMEMMTGAMPDGDSQPDELMDISENTSGSIRPA